jgi:fluoride ion exporter CrcB/FEX
MPDGFTTTSTPSLDGALFVERGNSTGMLKCAFASIALSIVGLSWGLQFVWQLG